MSDVSRHTISLVEEVTYGVTPVSPQLKRLRHTGTTLAVTKTANTSGEIRPDRQIADFRHGTKQVGGDISFELSFGSFDDYLEAVMCSDWAAKAVLAEITVGAAAGDSSFNDSGNSFIDAGFEVGDIITVLGFADPADNGTFRIATIAAGKITVTDTAGDAVALITEAAGAAVTIETTATVLKAGVERRSFTAVREFTDQVEADKPFHTYTGLVFNNLSLTLTPDAMVTGSFSMLGKDLTLAGTAPAGANYTAAPTTRVFDGFTGSLKEGGVTLAIITELGLTHENGFAPNFVLFSDTTDLPQIGQINLTGSVSLYFKNATVYEKFLDETPSSLEFTLIDKEGNAYTFVLPNISYTGGQPDAAGAGAITLTMPLQAVYDAASATNVKVTRTPAP